MKVPGDSGQFEGFVEVGAVDGLVVGFDSGVVGTMVEDLKVWDVSVDDGFVELSDFLADG